MTLFYVVPTRVITIIFSFSLPVEGKFNNYTYKTITMVIADIRLILENCYRYNGSGHWISKLAHKLEKVLDQKLALLNRLVSFKCIVSVQLVLYVFLHPVPSFYCELLHFQISA